MNLITLKKLFTFLIVFCALSSYAQERAKISGTITLNDGTAGDNISVSLKNTSYSSVTGNSGEYEITNVKPGSYTIRVSAVGMAAIEETITIAPGENTVRNFTVNQTQEQLSEVVIETEKTNKFTRTQSEVVSKMPLKDIENPQVYNTITAEVLKEQVVTNFDDALKNAPGLDKLWESTGRGGDGAGYFSLRGFAVQPTMLNGVPGLTAGSPDPANIERIEVIKGPSGTLFGSSLISYGGLINVTTKRPYNTFGGNISYTAGTYNLNRYTVDINSPIGTSNKAAVRINAAYHKENSFQDAGFKKSFFVAPSLSYQVNDKLSFFVNTEFYNGQSANAPMLFLDRGAELRTHNMKELGYDYKRSYTGNDLYIETPTFNLQAFMNYKINDNWTSQTILARSSAKSDGYYSYLYEGTQFFEKEVTQGVILNRYINKQNAELYGTDIQQNFIGDFQVAGMRNRVVVGLDYFNRVLIDNSSGYGANGVVYIGNNVAQFNEAVLDITDPSLFVDDSGILNQPGTDALLAGLPITQSKTSQEVYSIYASDVINFTPALSAMVSLRVDRFNNKGQANTKDDDYLQTAWSPKFGLVYQPILDKLSIFANYMNGFINTAPTTDRIDGLPVGVVLDPEQANQFEVGAKANFFNNKVTAAVSYYNTEVTDLIYTQLVQRLNPDGSPIVDEEGIPVVPNSFNRQDGAQTNKGFEVSITANPIEGLSLIAGYSYNDSKLTKGDPDFMGRRPESAGPRNLANFWASYRFNSGRLNGFGLGFGGNYGSENLIMNRNLAGEFTLPEYTILNASAFYTVDAFTLTLKVDNLTNEEYYKGWSTITPQRLRAFAANLTFNF